MSIPATANPLSNDHSRFSMCVPQPLWIGLATVVLVIVAVGIRAGVPIYRQQVAIREVERVGGIVRTRSRGPEWLRDRVGKAQMRPFEEVFDVLLVGLGDIPDTTLEYVGRLPELNLLGLADSRVTDAGLAHLQGLTKLTLLRLDGTQVTDAGLVHLERLTALETLSLRNTQITDAGLMHLKGLTSLKLLWLNDAKVTREGVEELELALPGLTISRTCN